MTTSRECVVIGGGPAGLAAAIALKREGLQDVLLLERDEILGGILNQCVHAGFGLSYFGKDYTGPEYADALVREFSRSGVDCRTGMTALEVTRSRIVKAISRKTGYIEIEAGAVVIATGCRERTRDNVEIPGTRPSGIYTAGQAQRLVNTQGFRVGSRVLIQGSGDIGLIMARRLAIEGYSVEGVYERLPYLSGLIRNKVQCLDHFGIPLTLNACLCEIVGTGRVEGAWIERLDEDFRPIPATRTFHECDTILFSVGLIPELDILRNGGLLAENGLAAVSPSFEIPGTGIFVAGNSCHVHDLADSASREGEAVGRKVRLFLSDTAEYLSSTTGLPPFSAREADHSHDQAFFERLERDGLMVCILCPKGCLVSEGNATCERGAAYAREARSGRRQTMTLSVPDRRGAGRGRLALRSMDGVDVSDIAEIRRALQGATQNADGSFAVRIGAKVVRFSSTARAGRNCGFIDGAEPPTILSGSTPTDEGKP